MKPFPGSRRVLLLVSETIFESEAGQPQRISNRSESLPYFFIWCSWTLFLLTMFYLSWTCWITVDKEFLTWYILCHLPLRGLAHAIQVFLTNVLFVRGLLHMVSKPFAKAHGLVEAEGECSICGVDRRFAWVAEHQVCSIHSFGCLIMMSRVYGYAVWYVYASHGFGGRRWRLGSGTFGAWREVLSHSNGNSGAVPARIPKIPFDNALGSLFGLLSPIYRAQRNGWVSLAMGKIGASPFPADAVAELKHAIVKDAARPVGFPLPGPFTATVGRPRGWDW